MEGTKAAMQVSVSFIELLTLHNVLGKKRRGTI